MNDTIVAISTPLGASVQAVLRLSGPEALRIVERRARVSGDEPLGDLDGFRQLSAELDWCGLPVPARLAVYRAPRSYTGEDIVELTVPGSVPLLAGLLGQFLRETAPGAADEARLARPGEFTLRAFLNGKIDLSQAEAVGRLIHAGGEREARAAYRQVGGALRDRVAEIERSITEALALVEAAFDFPDEELPVVAPIALAARVDSVRRSVENLLRDTALRLPDAGTLRIALVGLPNAGKSSLLNALVGRPLALVSDLAGTTRDPVRGFSAFGQWRLEWIDLAGLEESSWSLEAGDRARELALESAGGDLSEAIRRVSERELDAADLVLRVVDGTEACRLEPIPTLEGRSARLLVVSKCDLLTEEEVDAWTRREEGAVVVSSRSGQGLRDLLERVVAFAGESGAFRPGCAGEGALLISPVQESQLRRSHEALGRCHDALESGIGYELVAVDLRDALLALSPLTGREVSDRVLGAVFSQFCIGK